MTHVYRAVWTDNSMSLIDELPREFSNWLMSRGTPLDLKEDGVVVNGIRTAIWTTVENELGTATQMHLVEKYQGNWTTSVTAISTPDENVLWVDVFTDLSEDEIEVVYAPRLTRNLLLGGGEPEMGRDSIEVQPREVDDEISRDELLDGLQDQDRVLPYLVLRIGTGTERRLSIQRATRASETLAGLAQVFAVDEKSIKYLNSVLPENLRIEDVGSRLFMPGALADLEDEDLSFFVSSLDLDDNQKTLGRLALNHIWRTAQWPDVYEEWDGLKEECDEKRLALFSHFHENGGEDNKGVVIRAVDANELLGEIEQLNAKIQTLEEDLLVALVAADDEAARAEKLLDQLVGRMMSGEEPDYFKVKKQTVSETISNARRVLVNVEIPKSAEQSIQVLDDSESVKVWAGDISQLFIAMSSYAASSAKGAFAGNFIQWCQQTGEYPANKIAMKDSGTTKKDPKLRDTRVFAVSKSLDSSGLLRMEAHAKIRPKGDGRIPRVYFFDDTKGATKKMHIGFIGPHFLVPTSTF